MHAKKCFTKKLLQVTVYAVAAKWLELMLPQCTMQPLLPKLANNWTSVQLAVVPLRFKAFNP